MHTTRLARYCDILDDPNNDGDGDDDDEEEEEKKGKLGKE